MQRLWVRFRIPKQKNKSIILKTKPINNTAKNIDTVTRLRLFASSQRNSKFSDSTKSHFYIRNANENIKTKINYEEKKQLKHRMVLILEKYNLIPKQSLDNEDLLSTDELLKKMELMLASNKANWIRFLKHKYNKNNSDFLERLKTIDDEAKKKNIEEKKRIFRRNRGMSSDLLDSKRKALSNKSNLQSPLCSPLNRKNRNNIIPKDSSEVP